MEKNVETAAGKRNLEKLARKISSFLGKRRARLDKGDNVMTLFVYLETL